MIKFFRIIRQNLLSEGKTRKYFKYAIGEIVLVVIGILIAVGINSMYYASQNEAKIKVILEQVQQDLATDIVDAKRIFNTLIEKDSLFQKIMNDSITFEMYKKNPYPLPINGNYVSFSNKKGGYERFMDNLENLSEKYNVLLPHFNYLYFEIQNEIDDYNMHIKNTVMIDGREEYKTNPKVAEYDMNWDSEESLEFYFKDPFLKNKSSLYINDLSNISWAANIYSVESIIVYKKIDSLLGKTQVDYKEPLALLPEKDMLNSSLGDYAGTADVFGQTLSLSFENENLILKNSNTPDAQLYWHEGDYFFIKEAKPIFKIYKNKKEQHTIEINYRGTCSKFIKTKDL